MLKVSPHLLKAQRRHQFRKYTMQAFAVPCHCTFVYALCRNHLPTIQEFPAGLFSKFWIFVVLMRCMYSYSARLIFCAGSKYQPYSSVYEHQHFGNTRLNAYPCMSKQKYVVGLQHHHFKTRKTLLCYLRYVAILFGQTLYPSTTSLL